MLNSLSIKNFQSHKDSHLEFSPGVNLIMGKSDNGKSVCIRALNWILTNKPSGDSFRSFWGGDTEVELSTESLSVKRVKSKNENSYFLNDKEFKAFGQNVPDEILSTLNFSDANTQFQMDSHFLLSENSGEVARYFNKIVNLESIDNSLRSVDKEIRDINQSIKYSDKELKEEEAELQRYDWIEKAESEFKLLEKLYFEENKKRNQFIKLSDLASEIQEKQKGLKDIDFEKAINQLAQIQDKEKELKQLRLKQESLELIKNKYDSLYSEFKDIDFEKAFTEIQSTLTLQEQLKNKEEQKKRIKVLSEKAYNITEEQKEIEGNITHYESELKEIMPEVCPLCGQEIH